VLGLLGEGEIEFEVKIYNTRGDLDKETPISRVDGTNFFTDTIEKALLDKEIDAAVHSAKDLPEVIPEGLTIAALTRSIDPYDVLVVHPSLKSVGSLEKLPPGIRLGTSSLRRKEAIRKYRPDIKVTDIRGNIEERIEKLDRGEYEALVMAAAGLIRLGLEDRISQRIPFRILTPHPLQGRLSVEVRKEDKELIKLFRRING